MTSIANLVALAEITTDMLDEYSIQANHSDPSQIEHPIGVAAWIAVLLARSTYHHAKPVPARGLTTPEHENMCLKATHYLNAINKMTDHVWRAVNGAST